MFLTVLNVADGTILLEVDVEPVGLEVLGDHGARLNNAAFLWEVLLAEALEVCQHHHS